MPHKRNPNLKKNCEEVRLDPYQKGYKSGPKDTNPYSPDRHTLWEQGRADAIQDAEADLRRASREGYHIIDGVRVKWDPATSIADFGRKFEALARRGA
jgi:hypothetical protein